MVYNLSDTIVAISTAKGNGGIGIVRLSGILSVKIARELSGKKKIVVGINYASFFDANFFLIDSGLILFFNKPHSFTGEDLIEIHAHGNDLILESLVFRCIDLGARLAYNGEFSFRAFLNNKIDLIQAESINSLIKSNSLNSNKLIFKSLSGKFSDFIKVVISDLGKLKLDLDAAIEFPDHITFSFNDFYCSFLASYNNYLSIFDKVVSDDFLFESLNVVILGNVNVGKSSLFNFLLKTDRAIVSNVPGTTRDFIESNLCLNGFNFRLIDTAGFNPLTEDFIEKISIERTLTQIRKANILICVVDVLHEYDFLNNFNLNKLLLMAESKIKLILLRNKIDLLGVCKDIIYNKDYVEIFISVKTGEGIDLLLNELISTFSKYTDDVYFANKRQFNLLLNVKNCFSSLIIYDDVYKPLDFYSENIGFIISDLNGILGISVSNDILVDIFSNFCVGK